MTDETQQSVDNLLENTKFEWLCLNCASINQEQREICESCGFSKAYHEDNQEFLSRLGMMVTWQ